ncbi:MAG TPA: type II secretion system major pseudopilin GspG [Rhizomicrobium sp.]|nr:type II secretion system major pseudopilin GspG [Rhizomicrobium sp.]
MKSWKISAGTAAIPAAIRDRFLRARMSQCRGSGEAGYTLMELLVVLAILGLLAAVATPMVLHYLDSAKVSTAKTEVSNLSAGLDLFKYDVGRYPTTQEGLEALVNAPEGVENWNGPYIKKTTKLADPWGHPYNYKFPGTHGGEFDLYSYGAHADTAKNDEKPPIANW